MKNKNVVIKYFVAKCIMVLVIILFISFITRGLICMTKDIQFELIPFIITGIIVYVISLIIFLKMTYSELKQEKLNNFKSILITILKDYRLFIPIVNLSYLIEIDGDRVKKWTTYDKSNPWEIDKIESNKKHQKYVRDKLISCAMNNNSRYYLLTSAINEISNKLKESIYKDKVLAIEDWITESLCIIIKDLEESKMTLTLSEDVKLEIIHLMESQLALFKELEEKVIEEEKLLEIEKGKKLSVYAEKLKQHAEIIDSMRMDLKK